MHKFIFLFFFVTFVSPAEARERVFPEPVSSEDYIVIEDIEVLATYYGLLDKYPHTYLFEVTEPMALSVKVSVPDVDMSKDNRSLIVVRQEVRGVSEVVRVRAPDAAWDTEYDYVDAEHYRHGNLESVELEKGIYLLEVSTPDNIGQYVLTVGTEDSFGLFSYFTAVSDVYSVKTHLGKSGFAFVFSPLVYIPLSLILFGLLGLFVRKKYYA